VSLPRIKLIFKIRMLRNNMTYIQNTNPRDYKLAFADWFFRLIEELTYEIDVWLQDFWPMMRSNVWLGHCFKLHFHIYCLFFTQEYRKPNLNLINNFTANKYFFHISQLSTTPLDPPRSKQKYIEGWRLFGFSDI
jgi:hypothetical protein